MNRSRHAAIGLVATALLAAAGCTSDPDATASSVTSTVDPGTTEISSSVLPTSQASEPPPTSATTSTVIATTTTVDQAAATRAAVVAAVASARNNYLYAVRNYDAPDALAVLSSTTVVDSPSYRQATQNIDTLRSRGWRSRENPSVPSVSTVEGEVDLLDGPPATKAEVNVCTIDSGVVFEPGGAPDGSDTVVNDEIVAQLDRVTLVYEDGAWKLYEGTNIGSWPGQTACPGT